MRFRWPGIRRARAQQHFERALAFYDAGEAELAVADLTEAIRYNRRRADLYSARGLLWAEDGHFDYAAHDFDAALRLNAGEMLAHYGLGMIAHAEKDYETAIHHFTQAIAYAPTRNECYYFRSVCHYRSGALDQAESDMAFARQLMTVDDPRQLDAARWLGLYQRDREKIRRPRRRSKRK